jgi:hypothetical protein
MGFRPRPDPANLGSCDSRLAFRRKFNENQAVPTSTSHAREIFASLRLPGKVWLGSAPVEPVRRLATGIAAFDDLLGGGLPCGRLSEIVGAPSSGRTALAHALLAAATRRGQIAAVIDLPDALDPATLALAGADLSRVLWVRPAALKTALKCAEIVLVTGGFGLVVLDLDQADLRRLPLHVWPRLGRAARAADTALAVLAQRRVAGSFAACSAALRLRRAVWGAMTFEGIDGRSGPRLSAVSFQPSAS